MRETKKLKNLSPCLFVLILSVFIINFSSSIAAAESTDIPTRGVVVVEASGLMDPVMFEMMTEILEETDPSETIALVFQVNVSGSGIENEKLLN